MDVGVDAEFIDALIAAMPRPNMQTSWVPGAGEMRGSYVVPGSLGASATIPW